MANFDEAYRILMRNEGGYANLGTDSGGETYKGISRRWHPGWAGWAIIDAIKAVRKIDWNEEINDVNLKMNVKAFYKSNFWKRLLGDQIKDQSIANIMFDFMVMVDDDAVKMAQRIANAMGSNLDVDGKMGKFTLAAINSRNPEQFFYRYQEARAEFHRAVAANDPVYGAPNLKGWLKRLYRSFPDYVKKKMLA